MSVMPQAMQSFKGFAEEDDNFGKMLDRRKQSEKVFGPRGLRGTVAVKQAMKGETSPNKMMQSSNDSKFKRRTVISPGM
jgi:hypothetical protein